MNSKIKARSKAKSKSNNRRLIIRTCTGNPTAILFLNRLELLDLRSILETMNPDLDFRVKKIYEGIKREAEIEVEK